MKIVKSIPDLSMPDFDGPASLQLKRDLVEKLTQQDDFRDITAIEALTRKRVAEKRVKMTVMVAVGVGTVAGFVGGYFYMKGQ